MLVTAAPLNQAAVAAAIARSGDGAVTTFVGLVRDHNAGRRVLWLDYEAFAPLALKVFEQIAAEASRSTTAPAASRSAKRASSSPPRRRTAPARSPRAATPSSA